jgi:hypothetical protein
MTIVQAIIEVLKSENKPLKSNEIYQKIIDKKLYDFKAISPINIVRGQIRRHEMNSKMVNASSVKYFRELSDGSFELISPK